MNKFKLFLILMLASFMWITKVDAIVNMNGSVFTQAPQLDFFDNTRGTLTSVGAGYNSTYGYWSSNNSLITTGANTDGVNVTFTANEGFVSGYTYSLSILIGTESSRAKPSSTRICTAENIYNANTRFQQGYPCTNAISITSMDGLANFDFGDVSMPYTILTYVFTPDFTSPTITLTYNTVSGNNSRHLFGGYSLTVLSDNRNGISSNEVQSIINNSGLASADSVEELQTEIENVKEDINNASDAIVESNKETQDVIKDQFESCHMSRNLLLFTLANQTINGLSIINNGDGSLTLNGTTTDIISMKISPSMYNLTSGDYYFSINPTGNVSNSFTKLIYGIKSTTDTLMTTTNNSTSFSISKDYDEYYLWFYIKGGITFNNYIIKPMLNKGTNPLPWEPYGEEICTNRIDETNDQLGNLNDNITSSDTSSSEGQAGSFFENFNTTDNGGISSIVTAPLVAIDKMLSGTCSPLTATYKNKNISLPCGDSFWDDMPEIRNFLNIVLGGFLCYGILSKLYLLIDRLKNPEDDRVDVMKL